ncbi:MAG: calcineurin-like phosphoesterase family protein [Bacteroidales bacterium]|nr:calcineurin-like phosphoesterase family protein [Bacteroidales bacterium]
MNTKLIILPAILILLMTGFRNDPFTVQQDVPTVKGIVFFDKTGDGSYDPSGDKPLKGIAVSNGREVVITNRSGIYELPLRDNSAIFVIKPRNWMVPVDDNQLPRFYYLYSREGASGNNFRGLSPTGKIPELINFPLYPVKEPDSFDVLVLGDTQPRDDKEIYYTAHDVLPELVGIDAAFGITLGDIVFDDLNLYDHMIGTLSTIGIPMRYVPGNHDNDYSGNDLTNARGAWLRTFGPTYYSFSHGPVHFIVMDDIRWIVEDNKRYYRTGLGEDQMEFLRNEIKRLDKEQLLVLLSHIPYEASTEWENEAEKKTLYEIIASHTNTISLTAHTHQHYHQIIGKGEGYEGNKPHHMVSVGTVCGSWWTGAPDEYGIPHAMMSDGTPNCYTILHINGNKWKLSWKAPGKPADFQMHIDAPEMINAGKDDRIKITANIFNALPSADVKVRIGDEGEWMSMKRNLQSDPVRLAVVEREKQLGKVPWRNLGESFPSGHIWIAEPQIKLDPGVYVIHVKAVDEWWQYEGKRLLHIKK